MRLAAQMTASCFYFSFHHIEYIREAFAENRALKSAGRRPNYLLPEKHHRPQRRLIATERGCLSVTAPFQYFTQALTVFSNAYCPMKNCLGNSIKVSSEAVIGKVIPKLLAGYSESEDNIQGVQPKSPR